MLFQALDFSLHNLADECGAPLAADERVDPFAEAFRQAYLCRSHSQRRPSHSDLPIRTAVAFNENGSKGYRLLTEKLSLAYKRYRLLQRLRETLVSIPGGRRG